MKGEGEMVSGARNGVVRIASQSQPPHTKCVQLGELELRVNSIRCLGNDI